MCDNDFMESYKEDWGFSRSFGDISLLTTPTQLNTLMNTSDWLAFSNFERNDEIHEGVPRWVGGVMRTMASPGDPVFYLYHTCIEKVWDDWEEWLGRSSYIMKRWTDTKELIALAVTLAGGSILMIFLSPESSGCSMRKMAR